MISADTFDPQFYAADDALVGAVPATLPFRATVSRLVSGVADRLGLDDDALVERVTERFVDDALAKIRGNAPLLRTLGARYRLGLVSNFYGNLSTVCADCGIRDLFSVILDSVTVGCAKPDAGIFLKAVEALGLAPAGALFVGDSLPRDMAGARAVGMPHVWLAAASAGDRRPCCPGDAVIPTLADLEAVLP